MIIKFYVSVLLIYKLIAFVQTLVQNIDIKKGASMKILSCDQVTPISEFRKKPFIASGHKAICILKDGKPVFYTINQLRYAQLLKIEEEFNIMIKTKNLPF